MRNIAILDAFIISIVCIFLYVLIKTIKQHFFDK